MDSFDEQYQFYRSQHRTLGCKITHMFGVPMIAASIPTFFFNVPLAGGLFLGGWALQFLGHYIYEKNSPVLFDGLKSVFTCISALVFAAREWGRFLTGKPLVEPDDASTSEAL